MLENIKKPVFAMTHCQSFDKDNSKVFTIHCTEIKVFSISREESKEIECKRFPCLARLRPCFAAIGRFFTRLWRFITKDRDWTSREKKCIVAIVTSVLAAIVFLGLFPSSFVYLDYYEVYTLQSTKNQNNVEF